MPRCTEGTQNLLRWALSGNSLGGWVTIRCILLQGHLMPFDLPVLIEDTRPQRARPIRKPPNRWQDFGGFQQHMLRVGGAARTSVQLPPLPNAH